MRHSKVLMKRTSVLALGLATAHFAMPAYAQGMLASLGPDPQPDYDDMKDARPLEGVTLNVKPPSGFEDLENVYSTIYDVFYLGEYVGSYFGTLSGNVFSFEDPEAVVSRFDDTIDKVALQQLFSEVLQANGSLSCQRGEANSCGVLPSGQSGVVVNADTFRIDVSLSRDYLLSGVEPIQYLGDPISGPSFIQNIGFAGSFGRNGTSQNRAAFSFDTLASVGRSSLQVQSLYDDIYGVRVEELRAQRIEDTWKASIGMLPAQDSAVVRSYKYYGVEVTNQSGTRIGSAAGEQQSPVDVVLPLPATIEIYRDGFLVSAREYGAGLQYLNTDELPLGSYPITIIARAGSEVLFSETRIFSRTNNLPSTDRTIWSARIGQRTEESFGFLGDEATNVLPGSTGKIAAELRASHRISQSLSVTGAVSYIDDNLIPEAGANLYAGLSSVSIVGAAGTNGGYSVLGTFSRPVGPGSVAINYRSTRRSDAEVTGFPITGTDRYDPFLRDEDQIYANFYTPFLGGSLSMSGNYTLTSDADADRYRYGARYSRGIDIFDSVSTTLNFDATTNERESRFAVRMTFSARTSPASRVSGFGGVESYSRSEQGQKTAPTAQVDYTRFGRRGSLDYTTSAGVGTNAYESRAYVGGNLTSNYGAMDATLSGVQRESSGDFASQLTVNGHTGFAATTNAVQMGMREPGDAFVIMRVNAPKVMEPGPDEMKALGVAEATGKDTDQDTIVRLTPESKVKETTSARVASGGYQVILNNNQYGYIRGTGRSAVGVPSLRQYSVRLRPDGAPPYELDLTPRNIPLYPGNVAVIDWDAIEVATVFGRLLTPAGEPLRSTRLEAEGDMTMTDDEGYFTLTWAKGEQVSVYRPNGETCQIPIAEDLVDFSRNRVLYRVGDIVCR